jgi:hypothetical protein
MRQSVIKEDDKYDIKYQNMLNRKYETNSDKIDADERNNKYVKSLVQESESKSDTGCLMLDLKFKNWNKFLKQIPDEDLYTDEEEYGKELEPHCTVLYGFDQSVDVNKVKKYLQTLSEPIKLSLNKIDLFENDKFDVVKFSVVSKDLNKLHKFFKNNFENNESFDTYSPHVTIAYVKKGLGKKFVTNNFEPIELESTQFTYSLGKGLEKVKIDIGSSLNEYAQNILNKLADKFRAENPNLTDEQLSYYINRFDQLKSSPKVTQKDILKYSFADLEKLVDSFPTKMKSQPKSSDNNDVEFSDGELIYNKAPLQILHGDSPKQCVKIKGDFSASWCIARTSGNMYHNYRFGNSEPSFYFVKNLERLNKITKLKDDPYCFFVVQINNQGRYIVTSALNDGDKELTWEQLLKIEPLLQGTDKLFVHKALSDDDKADYKRFKNGFPDNMYKELSFDDKKKYISITNKLSDNQFEKTPDELINDYISIGSTLSDQQFDLIKNKKSLLNNYRRVTISSIPDYLNDDIYMDNRWSVLTDDEIIDIYEKRKSNRSDIIRYKPSMIKYFKDDISDFSGDSIVYILRHNPSLIKYFENNLKEIDAMGMSILLSYQPEFIKYFEDKLYSCGSNCIREILTYQPSLVKYFEKVLWKLSNIDLLNILKKQPQLTEYIENARQNFVKARTTEEIKMLIQHMPSFIDVFIDLFKDRLSEFDETDVKDIVTGNPSFAKYFKKDDINELVKLAEEFLNESESIDDEEINELLNHIKTNVISEALYQGKSVTLNKPTQGDVKKFKVYVKNKSGKVIKVNFGSKDYNIKKNNPDRKKSYCARSKGIEGGGTDKTKANYWSRRQWKC